MSVIAGRSTDLGCDLVGRKFFFKNVYTRDLRVFRVRGRMLDVSRTSPQLGIPNISKDLWLPLLFTFTRFATVVEKWPVDAAVRCDELRDLDIVLRWRNKRAMISCLGSI